MWYESAEVENFLVVKCQVVSLPCGILPVPDLQGGVGTHGGVLNGCCIGRVLLGVSVKGF